MSSRQTASADNAALPALTALSCRPRAILIRTYICERKP